jgi:hypothetical protein
LARGWTGDIIVAASVFVPWQAATMGVTRIDRYGFEDPRITILRHVQILCSECFSYCNSLSLISLETDSKLTRVEARAFAETRLSLAGVAENILSIAGDAFPRDCAVSLTRAMPEAELSEWNVGGQCGSSDALERRN